MTVRTKYELNDALYYVHKGFVRYGVPEEIAMTRISTDIGEVPNIDLITYRFRLGKTLVEKYENEVFKRRADLIKSLV